MVVGKTTFLLGWHIFRDYVNFREDIWHVPTFQTTKNGLSLKNPQHSGSFSPPKTNLEPEITSLNAEKNSWTNPIEKPIHLYKAWRAWVSQQNSQPSPAGGTSQNGHGSLGSSLHTTRTATSALVLRAHRTHRIHGTNGIFNYMNWMVVFYGKRRYIYTIHGSYGIVAVRCMR